MEFASKKILFVAGLEDYVAKIADFSSFVLCRPLIFKDAKIIKLALVEKDLGCVECVDTYVA